MKEAQEYGERYRIVQEKSGKYPDGTDRIIVSLFVEGGARGRAESAMRGGRQRHFGGKLHIETASYEGYESKSSNPPHGEAPIRQVDLILSQQINKAISDEIEAIRMYGKMGDMATDPDARAVFKNIAKEEMRHKEVLEELAAALRQRLGT